MQNLSTTLTQHARERLAERTKLTEDELLAALRTGKTMAFGSNAGGRLQLRVVYSVRDENYFVLPIDIARDRVCTVLPREMYASQRRAVHILPTHLFDAKSKVVEPLHAIHPMSGQAVRIQVTGYFLNGAGTLSALNLGHYAVPPSINAIIELGDDLAFLEGIRQRIRAKGLNPARLDSVYVRQGSREPIALPGVGPANPWATVGLFDVPAPIG